jgi:hypothetical protein
MSRKIGVLAGYWSTNIGNSFFQLGALHVLQKALPQDDVFLINDQPGYWNRRKGNPPTSLVLAECLKLDFVVLSGPVFKPEFPQILGQTLRRLHQRDVGIVVLSAGMMDYSPAAIRDYRRWISDSPPVVFTTRDSETYERLQDLARFSYDGIDTAFFVSDLHRASRLELGDYIVFNFDKWPEPDITISEVSDRNSGKTGFQFQSKHWDLRFPRIRTGLANRFWFYRYVDAFLPERLASEVGGFKIIRTEHRFNPTLIRKTYKGSSSFSSDIPQSYLDLYANCAATFSNRVHACVASMAYGNEAMLFSHTPRARLLERVGAETIRSRPTGVDPERISQEKAGLIEFLRGAFAQL